MDIGPGTIVTRRPDVLAEAVHDEVVVLDPVTSRYVRLNRTAAALWQALDEPATVATLAEAVAAQFGIGAERALADASAFVQAVAQRDLVTLAPPPSGAEPAG